MKILLKALFTMSIIAFVTVVTATKCDIKNSATLEVKILDETAAKLVDNGDGAIVYVLETKTRGKNALDNNNDYVGFSQNNASRKVFSVSMKDATSGLTFSNPAATATSLTKMSYKNIVGAIPGDGDFGTVNMPINVVKNEDGTAVAQPLKIRVASTWINRGFLKTDNISVAMVCIASFDIEEKRVNKITLDAAAALRDNDEGKLALSSLEGAEDKLTGAQESICSFGSTANTPDDLKDWADKAIKDDSASDTVELAFVGIDFDEALFGDFIKLAPNLLKDGLDSESIQKVISNYKYAEKKVTVKIVATLP